MEHRVYGRTGTFVNRKKIQKNKEIILNDGDKIGVGSPFSSSTKTDKTETFVYILRQPEAYRVQKTENESNAQTPPPVDVPEVVTAPTESAGTSGVDDSDSLVTPFKRKRVRKLLDSSDEDDGEKSVKKKRRLTQSPSSSFSKTTHEINQVQSCSVRILRVPRRAVGAIVDEDDTIVRWIKVGSEEYKRQVRRWRGLSEDGSQGTPLLTEMMSDDDAADDEQIMNDDDQRKGPRSSEVALSRHLVVESLVSSDDEDCVTSNPTPLSNDAYKPDPVPEVPVKQEPETPALLTSNYSINHDTVITIYDSEEELEYNQSQNILVDDEEIEDLMKDDRHTPDSLEEQFSDGEELHSGETDAEVDDDDIEILNASQTPLYDKIMNNSIKEETSQSTKSIVKPIGEHELQSLSLLEPDLDLDQGLGEMNQEMVDEIVKTVHGATESLVRDVHKNLLKSVFSPSIDDILPQVKIFNQGTSTKIYVNLNFINICFALRIEDFPFNLSTKSLYFRLPRNARTR